ncbi:MAG: SDR family NAD(P)-dependent oxidoreductase [Rhizobiales bacterium]|nr:SDR family NAD(P)-dependent oxidoreductase [Hyphomicrobiales bacterium]
MLDGEIALVTGAKGGIGAAAAKALAEAGARVIVTARRLADAEAVAGQCAEGRALGLACRPPASARRRSSSTMPARCSRSACCTRPTPTPGPPTSTRR